MAEALQFEKADEHGNTIKRFTGGTAGPLRKSRRAKKQRIDPNDVVASSDEDDCDYEGTELADSESTSVTESDRVSNAEVTSLPLVMVVFLSSSRMWQSMISICRSRPSYPQRLSRLWGGVLQESARAQSQQHLLRSNQSPALGAWTVTRAHGFRSLKSAALTASTATRIFKKRRRNQWCVYVDYSQFPLNVM